MENTNLQQRYKTRKTWIYLTKNSTIPYHTANAFLSNLAAGPLKVELSGLGELEPAIPILYTAIAYPILNRLKLSPHYFVFLP